MLEILLEEPSAEAALRILIPRLVPGAAEHQDFELRKFNGKADLLRKLDGRLRGYSAWAAAAGVRILLLVDRDDDDCADLKKKIDGLAASSGLPVHRGGALWSGGTFRACIACEEIEAWYLGDPAALRKVYSRLPGNFEQRSGFRDVDAVKGGTWEKLEKLLQDAGYFSGGLRKIELAKKLAPHMDLEANSSASFRHFRGAVLGALAGG
ncbi:DUF4276 family protein [Streptomyces johnsoniae]|uniref:DUF4276 family protein n=1 Tax=Streptomyces johnsoniae TaxID=3075532 RepID=A0ABU2S1D4_9ACTN|nr:DUF4276 family protein [Streptomyces sp. DSM 41886]MDT0441599.1 DUF4276 family protein [Streptomyces sp. DSM 41886]